MTDEIEPAVRAAQAAADAIRTFNHRTHPATRGAGAVELTEVYAVIGALAELVQRLGQSLDQTAHCLDRQHRAGRIDVASGQPDEASAAVDRALGHLHAASRASGGLCDGLRQAHTIAGRLRSTAAATPAPRRGQRGEPSASRTGFERTELARASVRRASRIPPGYPEPTSDSSWTSWPQATTDQPSTFRDTEKEF